jgi:hypothetical protein
MVHCNNNVASHHDRAGPRLTAKGLNSYEELPQLYFNAAGEDITSHCSYRRCENTAVTLTSGLDLQELRPV